MKMSIMLVNFLLLCLYGVVQGQTTQEPCNDDETGIACEGEEDVRGTCIGLRCNKGKLYARNRYHRECGRCSANNDPHFNTFDGNLYDYHGHMEYVLSQEGCENCPPKFANIGLHDCAKGAPWATCVDMVQFKPENHTTENITIYKEHPLSTSWITVDGNVTQQQVPCNEDGQVEVINGTNAYVWMKLGCIHVMGFNETGYLLRICDGGTSIYAHPDLFNNTCGLCGNWNNEEDPDMDLRFRNGTYFPVPDQSLPSPQDRIIDSEFGENWEVLPSWVDCSDSESIPPKSSHRRGKPCNADEEQYKSFRETCSAITSWCDGLNKKTIKTFIEGCIFDQCIAWRSNDTEFGKTLMKERKDLCKTDVASAPACSPGKCSFENDNGRCSRTPIKDFHPVGKQECSDGCKCYIKDQVPGCSPKECSFENDKGVCSLEPIDGFHPCGEQQCRDGCECYVEDAAEPKEPGINVNIKQHVNLNNGCGCPGCC